MISNKMKDLKCMEAESVAFDDMHCMLQASDRPFSQYCARLLTESLRECAGDKEQVLRALKAHALGEVIDTNGLLADFTKLDKGYRSKVAQSIFSCLNKQKKIVYR